MYYMCVGSTEVAGLAETYLARVSGLFSALAEREPKGGY